MNLQEAITLSELKAGGPGSGCRGSNCGRPLGSGKSQFEKELWKKTAAPIPVHVDYPKVSSKEKQLAKKFEKKQALGVEQMKQKFGHVAKTSDGTIVKEGDIVKLLKPDTLWNMKTGDVDKFPAGKLKGVIVNVLPKIGNNQSVKLNILPPTNKHEADQFRYLSTQDVKLHKAAGPTTIDTAPVPKSQIKQQYKSNDGAQVTIIKTSPEAKAYSPLDIKDLANRPSNYKGKFDQVEKVNGADQNITRVYDTSKVPSTSWGKEGAGTAAPRPGVTLWVHRYSDHVTIQEQRYQRWGYKAQGAIEWKYNNIGQAFGMLKKRYGISIPLSKERF
jgi:hypothetical protein